jgi:hypothetical protein
MHSAHTRFNPTKKIWHALFFPGMSSYKGKKSLGENKHGLARNQLTQWEKVSGVAAT